MACPKNPRVVRFHAASGAPPNAPPRFFLFALYRARRFFAAFVWRSRRFGILIAFVYILKNMARRKLLMTKAAIARRRRYRATKGTKARRRGGGLNFSKLSFGPRTTPDWLQKNRDRAQKKRWADHMAFLRRQPGYKEGGKGIADRPDLAGGLRRKRRLKMDRASVKRRAAYKRRK